MCNRDLQYFKKCLASRGEVAIINKDSQETTTYTNHNGKLVMISGAEKVSGVDAAISFLSSTSNPNVDMKVLKEGENSIDTEFLNFLNQAENTYKNGNV